MVEGTNDCVEHAGGRFASGYGCTWVDGRNVRAHRKEYADAHGLTLEDIKHLDIRHTCDNPPCVNPVHLVSGTHLDNMHDKVSRGRQMRGETHSKAKLTHKDVAAIRAQYTGAYGQQTALARLFGVTRQNIKNILDGNIWVT